MYQVLVRKQPTLASRLHDNEPSGPAPDRARNRHPRDRPGDPEAGGHHVKIAQSLHPQQRVLLHIPGRVQGIRGEVITAPIKIVHNLINNMKRNSGAEDKHGYLWDRHYGICLAKFPHRDVVNSVAFNPKDPEMLVTTSDDHTIKIWRSRAKVRQLGLPDSDSLPTGVEVTRNRSQRR